MKEFGFSFQEGLTKGLRRFRTNPRNEQSLVECHNLMPSDMGLEPHEALTSMDASGVTWGGHGAKALVTSTVTVTISIKDYVDEADIVGASVYIDDVYQGVTDSDGEITLSLTTGTHSIKVTKSGYADSDDDDLLNDVFTVTS